MKKQHYIVKCRLEHMIDIKHKKCITCSLKQPCFIYQDEEKALYCALCELKNMVDIVHRKCITCNFKKPLSIIKIRKRKYIVPHVN